jgi:hypothetical protein
MELWELVARERIRDTLARYNRSGDAQTFREDGWLDLRGSDPVRGLRYRDVSVPVDDDWLIRHRFVSTDWSSPDSTMAR